MKQRFTLFLLLLVLLCAACRHEDDARAAYDRYAVREELQVSLVKEFRMDSICCNFVILTPRDTATWFALTKEFGIPRRFATKDSTTRKHYITGYRDKKDPTQAPPQITLPSGKQSFDIEQSCTSVVDVANQKIFLIFAKDKESMYRIEDRMTDNL